MSERGVIEHKDRKRQINSFAGLVRHRNITPTDIDGLIDYNGQAFVVLEGKLVGAELKTGQRKAIENMCNKWNEAGNGNISVAIIYEHDTPCDEEVKVESCTVREFYWNGRWRIKEITVSAALDKLESYWKEKGISI